MNRDAAIEAGQAEILTNWSMWVTSPRSARNMAAAVLDAATPHLSGDEYHTLEELYLYRMLYHAHAANEWARHGTYPVVKSRFHSDGQPCFGGGWFIVVATLPTGQVSNHYKDEHWPLFQVPEVPLPPEYDGHTPQVAAERLRGTLDVPVTNTSHFVGEPVGYGYTADGWAIVQRTDTLAAARLMALVHEWRYAVALIRVEDQP